MTYNQVQSMTMRIIMWTLKLLDTESYTAKSAHNNVYMCIMCVCVCVCVCVAYINCFNKSLCYNYPTPVI